MVSSRGITLAELPATTGARLLRHVQFEQNSGCWLWGAGTNHRGYGTFHFGSRNTLTHRVSFAWFISDVPDKLHVLHRCDTPACINPQHLFLGDDTANCRDCAAKGRRGDRRGEDSARAQITEAMVVAIAGDLRPYADIAAEHGVTIPNITAIKNGRSWQHVDCVRVPRGRGTKLSSAVIAAILSDPRTSLVVGPEHGIHPSSVSRIRRAHRKAA